jgi:hypothetical protein
MAQVSRCAAGDWCTMLLSITRPGSGQITEVEADDDDDIIMKF